MFPISGNLLSVHNFIPIKLEVNHDATLCSTEFNKDNTEDGTLCACAKPTVRLVLHKA